MDIATVLAKLNELCNEAQSDLNIAHEDGHSPDECAEAEGYLQGVEAAHSAVYAIAKEYTIGDRE